MLLSSKLIHISLTYYYLFYLLTCPFFVTDQRKDQYDDNSDCQTYCQYDMQILQLLLMTSLQNFIWHLKIIQYLPYTEPYLNSHNINYYAFSDYSILLKLPVRQPGVSLIPRK